MLNAAQRLTAKKQVLMEPKAPKDLPYHLTLGANSFQCRSPGEAYTKAGQFIKQLESDGFKYTRHGAMSHKLDVYKKGSTEISVGALAGVLMLDLWT